MGQKGLIGTTPIAGSLAAHLSRRAIERYEKRCRAQKKSKKNTLNLAKKGGRRAEGYQRSLTIPEKLRVKKLPPGERSSEIFGPCKARPAVIAICGSRNERQQKNPN